MIFHPAQCITSSPKSDLGIFYTSKIAVVLNNNEIASCVHAAWILQSLHKHTACGQLSEVAARLAEIMHYDPKIDSFCKNPATTLLSPHSALCVPAGSRRCVHMCTSMCLAVGVHVPPSLRTPQCVKGKR